MVKFHIFFTQLKTYLYNYDSYSQNVFFLFVFFAHTAYNSYIQ